MLEREKDWGARYGFFVLISNMDEITYAGALDATSRAWRSSRSSNRPRTT